MFTSNIQATTTFINYLCMSNLGKFFGYTYNKIHIFQIKVLRIITYACGSYVIKTHIKTYKSTKL